MRHRLLGRAPIKRGQRGSGAARGKELWAVKRPDDPGARQTARLHLRRGDQVAPLACRLSCLVVPARLRRRSYTRWPRSEHSSNIMTQCAAWNPWWTLLLRRLGGGRRARVRCAPSEPNMTVRREVPNVPRMERAVSRHVWDSVPSIELACRSGRACHCSCSGVGHVFCPPFASAGATAVVKMRSVRCSPHTRPAQGPCQRTSAWSCCTRRAVEGRHSLSHKCHVAGGW